MIVSRLSLSLSLYESSAAKVDVPHSLRHYPDRSIPPPA